MFVFLYLGLLQENDKTRYCALLILVQYETGADPPEDQSSHGPPPLGPKKKKKEKRKGNKEENERNLWVANEWVKINELSPQF